MKIIALALNTIISGKTVSFQEDGSSSFDLAKQIDLIEERGGKLFPYEFKWSIRAKVGTPKEWIIAYWNL